MAEEPGSGKPLSRLKGLKDSIDRSLDKRLTKAAESIDRSSEAAGTAKDRASAAMKKVDETGGRYIDIVFSREGFYNLFDKMIEHPMTTLMITLIITSILIVPLIKWDAIDRKLSENEDPPNMLGYLNLNMNAAFDVYLPEGEETSNILNEVRENWTIDLFVLYFETQNAFDRNVGTNITDVGILEEITVIERGLNWMESDRGDEDDVIYVLSIASIIRELNGSVPQSLYAFQHQVAKATGSDTGWADSFIDYMANQSGSYEIPDDQEDIDDWVHQVEERILGHIVVDTNGDGIWDSAICLIGLVAGLDFDDITDRVRDSYQNEVREYNSRVSSNMKLKVRDTGTIPVTKDVQDRSVKEGINALIIATLFILVALFVFHRTLKILFIALVPVSVSMALTFSIIAITKLPITPQVIAVGPILIALGVAYGLYIANRYAVESHIEDKQERIKVAVRTTGKAVFLSAITTAGGFASLMVTNILPMQTVGLTLTLGIIVNYLMAMLLVPPLVLILDYHKRGDALGDKFKVISPIPIKHTNKILAGGIALLLLSFGILMSGGVGSDVDFLSFAPEDQESLVTYKDYAEIFKGGEIGMVIVRGAPAIGDDYENSMKDYDVLQSTENLENQINEVEDTWAISIVDIFKTLRLRNLLDAQDDYDVIPALLQLAGMGGIDQQDEYLNMTYWDLIEQSPENKQPYNTRLFWIEMVYDSLSPELREFFINSDYSKMLIFIDMPIESVAHSRAKVDGVNDAVEKWPAGQSTSKLTGVAAIGITVNDLIFVNAITSMILSLVFVLIVLMVIFRSVRYSVITVIPLSIVVGLLPLTLYLFNTPLTIITAMLGSIVVGAGVDFSIHTTERLREEGETLDGVKTTIETSGRSFVEATVVTLAGLTAGFFIPIQPIYVFIGLIMVLLSLCVIAALFYLTAIYAYLIRGRLYDELMYGRRDTGASTEIEVE